MVVGSFFLFFLWVVGAKNSEELEVFGISWVFGWLVSWLVGWLDLFWSVRDEE